MGINNLNVTDLDIGQTFFCTTLGLDLRKALLYVPSLEKVMNVRSQISDDLPLPLRTNWFSPFMLLGRSTSDDTSADCGGEKKNNKTIMLLRDNRGDYWKMTMA